MGAEADHSPDAERFFLRVRELLPSFAAVDDSERADWNDPDGPLFYMRVSALARHLAVLAASGQWREVRLALDEAELTIESGDKYARDLMVVGLLEDLQNNILRSEGRVRLVDVRALLGRHSLEGWDDLMRFWYGPAEEARHRLPPGSLPNDG